MLCHGRLLAHCPLSHCCSIRRRPIPHNIAICFKHINDRKWLYQRDFREWHCLLWFWVPWLPTCMIKRGPLCHPLNWFFHGKLKGSSILYHGHVHLPDMNSGMEILYVQCHTTQEISWTLIKWLQIAVQSLQPPFKKCNWGHGPGGNMTLRSINSACNAGTHSGLVGVLSSSSLHWRTRESASSADLTE